MVNLTQTVFEYDFCTGFLTISGAALDREAISTFKLELVAKEMSVNANEVYTMTVDIDLADRNDNSPLWYDTKQPVGVDAQGIPLKSQQPRPYVANVTEHDKGDTLLLYLEATDADAALLSDESDKGLTVDSNFFRGNGYVTYAITAGDPKNQFKLVDNRIYRGNLADLGGIIELRTSGVDLDRETNHIYKLTITATDQGSKEEIVNEEIVATAQPKRSTDTIVTINILDENDNSPIFGNPKGYTFGVNEEALDTTVGTVTATDLDAGTNQIISYTILSGNDDKFFGIDSTTGRIFTTQKKVNRETDGKTFTLNIQAEDAGTNPNARALAVVIVITDLNDLPPTFDQVNVAVVISENTAARDLVATVSAKDGDAEVQNSKVRFSLEATHGGTDYFGQYFEINAASGELRLKKMVNYEDDKLFAFRIRANNPDAASDLTSTIEARITVVDYNDNYPTFDDAVKIVSPSKSMCGNAPCDTNSYSVIEHDVSEGAPLKSTVFTIRTSDNDAAPNNVPWYYMVNSTDSAFAVDKTTGVVSAVKKLDLETHPMYWLWVQVKDGGTPTLASLAWLRFETLDVNDNDPVFDPASYKYKVRENTDTVFEVGAVKATDEDATHNGKIRYSIAAVAPSNPGVFEINPTSGMVSTSGPVDRENVVVYTLTVTASDLGTPSRSTNTTVEVEVIDANDNDPIFGQIEYRVTHREQRSGGEEVVKISSTDRDAGPNQAVVYAIASGDTDSAFKIDPTSGQISTTKPLDRETVGEYILVIAATDQAVDPTLRNVAKVNVYVDVVDINDFSPTFKPATYAKDVPENTAVTSEILRVYASDKDEGANMNLTYSIVSGDKGRFTMRTLDSTTGILTLADVLDRERAGEDSYSIVVEAKDGATPPRSTNVIVVLTITDINDNTPIFTKLEYTANLTENVALKTLVGTVSASDLDIDANQEIEYAIVRGNTKARFAIDKKSGAVTVNDEIDREDIPSFDLVISATDQGAPSLTNTTTMRITIVDENDNDPKFSHNNPETKTISEFAKINDVAFQFDVTDEDEGLNAKFTYKILSGNEDAKFKLQSVSSPKLLVAGSLDRESQGKYTLVVQATDSVPAKRSSKMTLVIFLGDENDNAPKFGEPIYRFDLTENCAVGTQVGTALTTSDKDTAQYSNVVYTITSIVPSESRFAIAGDGTISTLAVTTPEVFPNGTKTGKNVSLPVDREAQLFVGKAVYRLTVQARDKDSSNLKSTAYVYITIIDENDNAPDYGSGVRSVNILEEVEPKKGIFDVKATDLDANEFGEMKYEIVTSDGPFAIDADSATISVVKKLDYEVDNHTYTLTVRASEKSSAGRSAMLNLTVLLIDINDNNPLYNHTEAALARTYDVRISDIFPVDGQVTTLLASDRDSKQNANITFAIMEGNVDGLFAIGAQTGIITTLKPVDRTLRTSYKLIVEASDHGVPVKSTNQTVVVTISMFGMFPTTNYVATLNEYVPKGSTVYDFKLTDAYIAKIPNVDNVKYTCTSKPQNDFVIDEQTGLLTTNALFDAIVVSNYTTDITVTAYSKAGKELFKDVAVAELLIENVNNAPQITSSDKQFEFAALEGKPKGFEVASMTAIDTDRGNDGKLTFELRVADATYQSLFKIVESSGKLDANNNIIYAGSVQLARVLDREETGSFLKLEFVAIDGGKLESSVSAEVTVLDLNDNAPKFLSAKGYSSHVEENSPSNVPLAKVSTTDRDEVVNSTVAGTYLINNGVVSYAITGGDDLKQFQIDETSGSITTSSVPLDYEDKEVYSLEVTATDQAGILVDKTAARDAKTTKTTVTITIEDLNDNTPMFNSTRYAFNVHEEALDATVGKVVATDRDDGNNKKISYTILSGNENKLFGVSPSSGRVYTTAQVDRETHGKVFNLTIQAEDAGTNPNRNTTQAIISIVDINDFPPTFDKSELHMNMTENTAARDLVATVSAKDGDAEVQNSKVRFSLEATHGGTDYFGQYFEINAASGELRLKKMVNYEDDKLFAFRIRANNPDAASDLTSTIEARITVVDYNDNYPTFDDAVKIVSPSKSMCGNAPCDTNSYSVIEHDVSEGAPLKSTVFTIRTSDNDAAPNNVPWYYMVNSTDSAFAVDKTTGVVSAVKKLDLETHPMYWLWVQVKDGGTPTLASLAWLRFETLDVNDNDPVFDPASYKYKVRENTDTVFEVGAVKATDEDATHNGKIRYSIAAVAPSNPGVFEINPTSGMVSTSGPVDRENVVVYTLTVTASDLGTPSRSTNTTVEVEVIDANDNDPIFGQIEYRVTHREQRSGGEEVVKISSTDRDAGPNQAVVYAIASGDTDSAFKIDPTSGQISTTKPLDRETVGEYILVIAATDQAVDPTLRNVAKVNVYVDVVDINDFSPTFKPATYAKDVPENTAVTSEILRVYASDKDEGANMNLTYSIVSGDKGRFTMRTLDSTTGILTLADVLDRERAGEDSYSIVVEAKDGATPPRSTNVIVVLTITDINDNTPIFTKLEYTANLTENVALKTLVGTVSASDLDIDANQEIEYAIVRGNTKARFAIDKKSGAVTVNDEIDREDIPSFDLVISATDQGAPSLTATTTMRITIVDENDNAPKFDTASPTKLQLAEYDERSFDAENASFSETFGPVSNNTASATQLSGVSQRIRLVATFNVTDKDEISVFRFYIANIKPAAHFRIDAATGQLFINYPLDRETWPRYEMVIRVDDNATTTLSTHHKLVIDITDINDNAPQIVTTADVTISEGKSEGTFVQSVKASDRDIGNNEKLSYKITRVLGNNGELVNPFTIDTAKGTITMASRLDREATQSYNISVLVSDAGVVALQCYTHFTVTVDDINDNIPFFTKKDGKTPIQSDFARIDENAGINANVITMYAYDIDKGLNSQRSFELVPSSAQPFAIDPTTGIVYVTGKLNREQNETYDLKVHVKDAGILQQQKSPALTVSILIDDVNDNAPVFEHNYVATTVAEDIAVDALLLNVTATDKDHKNNNTVKYFLANATQHFRVDSRDGGLYLNKKLDYETAFMHTIRIGATDSGFPPITSYAIAQVHVTDVNDNHPQLLFPDGLNITLSEMKPVSELVYTVQASDRDSGDNKKMNYLFNAGSNQDHLFALDPMSGILSVNQLLDRETWGDSHTLHIVVKDLGNPQLASLVHKINIAIQDENDNIPKFTQQVYSAKDVTEYTSVGATVLSVKASDKDLSGSVNARLTYSIEGGDTDGVFAIDSGTGKVTCAKLFDYETTTAYNLTIRVVDGGVPRNEAISEAHVYIKDENDNRPLFNSTAKSVIKISELIAAKSDLGSYSATDADQPSTPNSNVIYSVAGGRVGSQDLFMIDASGSLFTKHGLDHEVVPGYDLIVTATDKGSPAMSSTFNVRVELVNENDNLPVFKYQDATHFEFPEDTPSGTNIATIAATDPDELDNNIQYTIVGGDAANRFKLNPNTGVLSTATTESAPWDREASDNMNLLIKATDSEGNGKGVKKFALTQYTFTVLDVNDNSPKVLKVALALNPSEGVLTQASATTYDLSLTSYVESGSVILTMNASDRDLADNGLAYFSVDNSCPLNITTSADKQTGSITTPVYLATVTSKSFFCTLTVHDLGGRSSSVTVRVHHNAPPAIDSSHAYTQLACSARNSKSNVANLTKLVGGDNNTDMLGLLVTHLSSGVDWFVHTSGSTDQRQLTGVDANTAALIGPNDIICMVPPSTYHGAVTIDAVLVEYVSFSKKYADQKSLSQAAYSKWTRWSTFSKKSAQLLSVVNANPITPPVLTSVTTENVLVEEDVGLSDVGMLVDKIVLRTTMEKTRTSSARISNLPTVAQDAIPLNVKKDYDHSVAVYNNIAELRSALHYLSGGPGIAITHVNEKNGKWQYSKSAAQGFNWKNIASAETTLGSSNALLLAYDVSVRYLPKSGSLDVATITYKLWDGVAPAETGVYRETNVSSAFGTGVHTSVTSIIPVNDRPTLFKTTADVAVPYSFYESMSYATVLLLPDTTEAKFRKSEDIYKSQLSILLKSKVTIHQKFFIAGKGLQLTISASTNAKQLLLTHDDITQIFSDFLGELLFETTTTKTPTLLVAGQNAQCTGDFVQFGELAPNAGQSVSSLLATLGAQDDDSDVLGLAVLATPTCNNGIWQYQNKATESWLNMVTSTSKTSALVVPSTGALRFSPKSTTYWATSTACTLSVKAQDGSGNAQGSDRLDVSGDGDNSAHSRATAIISATRLGCDDAEDSGAVFDQCCSCNAVNASSTPTCNAPTVAGSRHALITVELQASANVKPGDKLVTDSAKLVEGIKAMMTTRTSISGDHVTTVSLQWATARRQRKAAANVLQAAISFDASVSISDAKTAASVLQAETVTVPGDGQDSFTVQNTKYGVGVSTVAIDTCNAAGDYLDECGVCGGDGSSCRGCDGITNSPLTRDECGVCNGGNRDKDCNGDCFGGAVVDGCNECSGGKTGLAVNKSMDCNGDCFGLAMSDFCGECYGGKTKYTANRTIDCNNVCGGNFVSDPDCNVCQNPMHMVEYKDCEGTCFGKATCVTPDDRIPTNCQGLDAYNPACFDVLDLAPSSGTFNGGSTIFITGVGFGVGDKIFCSFYRKKTGSESEYNAQELMKITAQGKGSCRTPIGVPVPSNGLQTSVFDFKLREESSGHETSRASSFTFYDPGIAQITSVSPNMGLITEDTSVVVSGSGMINMPGLSCFLQATKVKTLTQHLSSTSVKCTMPKTSVSGEVFVCLAFNGLPSELDVSSPSTNNLCFRYTYKSPSASITHVTFNPTLRSVNILWDAAIKDTGTDCSNYLSPATISTYVKASTCILETPQRIRMDLASDAHVMPRVAIQVASYVPLVAHHKNLTLTSTASTAVSAVKDSVKLTAMIEAPGAIPLCGSLILSGAASTGGGYFGLKYSWAVFVLDKTTSKFAALDTTLANMGNDLDTIALDASYFVADTDYTFVLTVVNFMGDVSTAASVVLQQSKSVRTPVVSILGSSPTKTIASEAIIMRSSFKAESCNAVGDLLVFSWVIDLCVDDKCSRIAPAKVDLPNANQPNLVLPANSLMPGNRYRLKLNVHAKDWPLSTSSASVAIDPVAPPAKCAIAGGDAEVPLARSGETMLQVVGGTFSSVKWLCTQRSGLPCFMDGTNFAQTHTFAHSSQLTLTAKSFAAGLYDFTASVKTAHGKTTKCSSTVTFVSVPLGRNESVTINPTVGPVDPTQIIVLTAIINTPVATGGMTAIWSAIAVPHADYGSQPTLANAALTKLVFSVPVSKATTATTSLALKANALKQGVKYRFGLTLKINTVDDYDKVTVTRIGYAETDIQTADGPRGELVINKQGKAILETTALSADGWTLPNGEADVEHYYSLVFDKTVVPISSQSLAQGITVRLGRPQSSASIRLTAVSSSGVVTEVDKAIEIGSFPAFSTATIADISTSATTLYTKSQDWSGALTTLASGAVHVNAGSPAELKEFFSDKNSASSITDFKRAAISLIKEILSTKPIGSQEPQSLARIISMLNLLTMDGPSGPLAPGDASEVATLARNTWSTYSKALGKRRIPDWVVANYIGSATPVDTSTTDANRLAFYKDVSTLANTMLSRMSFGEAARSVSQAESGVTVVVSTMKQEEVLPVNLKNSSIAVTAWQSTDGNTPVTVHAAEFPEKRLAALASSGSIALQSPVLHFDAGSAVSDVQTTFKLSGQQNSTKLRCLYRAQGQFDWKVTVESVPDSTEAGEMTDALVCNYTSLQTMVRSRRGSAGAATGLQFAAGMSIPSTPAPTTIPVTTAAASPTTKTTKTSLQPSTTTLTTRGFKRADTSLAPTQTLVKGDYGGSTVASNIRNAEESKVQPWTIIVAVLGCIIIFILFGLTYCKVRGRKKVGIWGETLQRSSMSDAAFQQKRTGGSLWQGFASGFSQQLAVNPQQMPNQQWVPPSPLKNASAPVVDSGSDSSDDDADVAPSSGKSLPGLRGSAFVPSQFNKNIPPAKEDASLVFAQGDDDIIINDGAQ